MIDTHTHLYMPEFDTDTDSPCEAVRRAIGAGVNKMVFPAVDPATAPALAALSKEFPGVAYTALALHPSEVTPDWRVGFEAVERCLASTSPVAIGETGIDLYWDTSYRGEQIEAFAAHVALAKELDLPLIIHCRAGLDEVLDVLKAPESKGVQAVFHCFTQGPEVLETICKVGDFYFGIGGVVTFKNARSLHDAVRAVSSDRIVLETDSPYLAPVPHRGKRNESAYLPAIVNAIAALRAVSAEAIVRITDANALRLFPKMNQYACCSN